MPRVARYLLAIVAAPGAPHSSIRAGYTPCLADGLGRALDRITTGAYRPLDLGFVTP